MIPHNFYNPTTYPTISFPSTHISNPVRNTHKTTIGFDTYSHKSILMIELFEWRSSCGHVLPALCMQIPICIRTLCNVFCAMDAEAHSTKGQHIYEHTTSSLLSSFCRHIHTTHDDYAQRSALARSPSKYGVIQVTFLMLQIFVIICKNDQL